MKKNKHAVALGRLGKGRTSPSKARSSKLNGRLGGRPAKIVFSNWTKFMDLVDECRRSQSVSPLHIPFLKSKITRERALLNSTAHFLCVHEFHLPVPSWAEQTVWLKDPWFVSGIENLKAMALVESPIEFRANHIFVLNNFLSRV